ncbi:hypothetical protein D9M69_606630 [compost metagenome]
MALRRWRCGRQHGEVVLHVHGLVGQQQALRGALAAEPVHGVVAQEEERDLVAQPRLGQVHLLDRLREHLRCILVIGVVCLVGQEGKGRQVGMQRCLHLLLHACAQGIAVARAFGRQRAQVIGERRKNE